MQEILLILRTTTSNPILLVRALLDIFLVALPFYMVFTLLRESRSFVALWGIVTLVILSFALYLAAQVFDLRATALLYEKFWTLVVLVFLIVFQGELRKGLADIGRLRLLRAFLPREAHSVVEVVRAVELMAEKRVGALIAFERGNSLRPYTATGTILDAEISSELLRAVFIPQSPLHDGAAILRGGRVVAVQCILPLTEDPRLSKDLGTRHRAAIGLTEESDALVVVVSEESGTISLAREGRMERFLEPDDLRRMLERELDVDDEPEAARA